jgi:hypothetical protein
MAAIDEVIARARQGEAQFSERKQFKLARRRAIEKLRRFALADPYFYILEIIQAAIAGGADFVDISCAEGEVLISWTGGVLREDELAQLFDFLFASKERLDLAHVRSLALGVNALLLFEPDQVVIESGDGKPGNTARMVVRAGAESVEVGRAAGSLEGTYVRASKLNRKKVAAETGRQGGDDGGLEYATVETRCLTAPVPLVFNGQPLFGWSRQRLPSLFGFEKACSFDEGDLYGSIGVRPHSGLPSFQLLTHGVWVQSYQYELLAGHKIGGIVCFDRLHKTVDHSGFVRDDRFEEMWLRLRPHAEAMIGGKQFTSAKITSAGGMAYSPNELRELLREHPRVVIVAPNVNPTAGSQPGWRGSTIARMLDAELLRVPDTQVAAVRVLGGRDVLLWRPYLGDGLDQEFYNQAPLEPTTPYLFAPVDVAAPALDALVTALFGQAAADGDPANPQLWTKVLDEMREGGRLAVEAREGTLAARVKAQLRVMLGETGAIRATLFTPVDPGEAAHGLLVRVTSTGRLIDQRVFASPYPGRILDVELPTAQPSTMRRHLIALRIAEVFAELAVPVLREQDRRTLAGLGVGKIEPDSAAARLAMQVLSRVTVTRLRAARPGRLTPGLSFSLLRPVTGSDPLSLELLRTVSGRPLSLRALALLSDETAGLVYGTIAEVPADLDGLDTDRILALDEASERTLIGLLGEAGYVRVDARDVLTEHAGVKVRDVALGLRDYVEFPLAIEGQVERLEQLGEAGRAQLLHALVQGLIDRMLGRADEPDRDALELEEHRRQAVRHLQWYACRELAAGHIDALERSKLLDLPLFIDIYGDVWSLRDVHAALCSSEGLLVHHAHVFGVAELGMLAEAGLEPRAAGGRPSSLAVSAFCYRLLLPLGRVRIAFDFDLDDAEAARNPMSSGSAFLVQAAFESPAATGVLGVPAIRPSEHRIQVRVRGRGSIAALDEVARQYGIVGSIELDNTDWSEGTIDDLLGRIHAQAQALLEALIKKLPELDDAGREDAAVQVLLNVLGDQLTLTLGPTGLVAQLGSELAQRIASLPLFDTGATTLVSAQRMIDVFRRRFEAKQAGRIDWSSVLVAGALPSVRAWLETRLQPAQVVTPASVGARVQAPAPTADEGTTWNPDRELPLEILAANLGYWLERLRPDPHEKDGKRDRATRVWVAPHPVSESGKEDLVAGSDMRLDVYGLHPLVARVCASPTASNFAWMLLAVYAYLNASTGMISNYHEVQFQLLVADALLDGRLRVLDLPEAPPRAASAQNRAAG